MLRLISILLVLIGLGAITLGVMAWVSPRAPDRQVESAPVTRDAAPGPTASGFEDGQFGIASTATSPLTESLRRLPIAHEAPETATFGRAFNVTLAIDATGAETPEAALPGRGTITEGVAELSGDVRASLIGPAFDIEALSPSEQTLSPLTQNTWRWQVTPRAPGEQELVLEIYALHGERALPVRSFRDSILVEVSRLRQALSLAQVADPFFVVLGGIGSVLGGLFGVFRVFRFRR